MAYITQGSPSLGPVYQPSSSLALDHDPVSPPDGKCGGAGCGPFAPPVHKLGVKRESRAAACARCAARGAQCRGTLAACPLCGAQSSCRRLSRTYDSWQRIYVCTKGIRSKNGGLPLVDSDFVEQYPRWSATHSLSVRSSIVVRGTCDRIKSVYYAVLRTLLAYATQGNHNPCRTVCWHWLS